MRFVLLVTGLALITTFAPAQRMGGMRTPRYDPAKEVTIQGTVEEVLAAQRGGMMGIHLSVKTADQTFEIRLGPAWFLEQKNFVFAKGDQIEATGAKMPYRGADVIIAREPDPI